MTYSTHYITTSRDGRALRLVERSAFRDKVQRVVEGACALTGHRWCGAWVGPVMAWADRAETIRATVPVDRATAEAIVGPEPWGDLDDGEVLHAETIHTTPVEVRKWDRTTTASGSGMSYNVTWSAE